MACKTRTIPRFEYRDKTMNIVIAGSSGLIGNALRRHLAAAGHRVCRLVRHPSAAGRDEIVWNPAQRTMPIGALASCDVVINLCGENIFGLWTPAKKRRLYSSRIVPAAFLAEAIAASNPRPRVFICASAMGYYGSRGDQILTEQSPTGGGFLAELCSEWEKAAVPESPGGVRVVHLRLGMVLAPAGGALAKMLPLFKMGLGGRLGDGTHWQSWISLTDAVRAIEFAMQTDSLCGPVNIVSPSPVRNADLTRMLAACLHHPAKCNVPAFILRLLPGQFAQQVLLSSVRALPDKLTAAGFVFEHPQLQDFLRACLPPRPSA